MACKPNGGALSAGRGSSTDLLSYVGNTPLVRLRELAADLPGVEVFAKVEWTNPGNSVKARAAWNIVLQAERSGLMTRDKILLDSTSGNTGIAYAMICAARGYRLKLFMPSNVSMERKRILTAYGAEIVYTDPMEGSDGSIQHARELAAKEPETYFYGNQYDNPANWMAHYQTTGPEIFAQTEGRVTHFVAGLGTTGTFVGTSRRLKELQPGVRCYSVQPDAPFHGVEGLKNLSWAIVPRIFDASLVDENLEVSTEDAHAMVLRLAREEGLFVGVSAGAATVAALRVARRIQKGVVVTIFPDNGEKYLSESFWDEAEDACLVNERGGSPVLLKPTAAAAAANSRRAGYRAGRLRAPNSMPAMKGGKWAEGH